MSAVLRPAALVDDPWGAAAPLELAPAPASTPTPDGTVTVHAATTDIGGRFLLSAGSRHFVSDARAASGGPGEAVTAGELLLSSLASCALAVIQHHAAELGFAAGRARVETRFTRDPEDGTRYAEIVVRAALPELDRARGQQLLDRFTATCPIYNTLRRGGPIRAELA